MLEWLWPYAFLLAPLPLAVRYLAPARPVQQAALTVPSVAAFDLEPDTANLGAGTADWRPWVLLVAWLLLVTAVARPQWTGEPTALPTTGRDLMLAVDISGSMGTEDMALAGGYVDRLSVVKEVVAAFLDQRAGDRVGLILFGTNAYLQAPLTFDLTSVAKLLIEAPVGIAGGKTAIGDAIGLAIKRLRERPEGNRVLVLLTDGASNVGEVAPMKAGELAALEAIKIYTIGVGSTEMRPRGIFDALGSALLNPSADLDEQTLTDIAAITGGRYFRAKDTASLVEIYRLIDQMEPIEQDPETLRPVRALYMWPLAFGLVALGLLLAADLARHRHG